MSDVGEQEVRRSVQLTDCGGDGGQDPSPSARSEGSCSRHEGLRLTSDIRHPTSDIRHPLLFAIASHDEIWQGGTLFENRIEHGEARQRRHEIVARDSLDAGLRSLSEAAAERLRPIAESLTDARVRIISRAMALDGVVSVEAAMTISIGGVSIVTDAGHADADIGMLRRLTGTPVEVARPAGVAMVWRNGSASVLFHEAAGHAAEHGCPPLAWPEWLRVEDHASGARADLLRGELPAALRRASFRDVPLPRMTNVRVVQEGAPFEEPGERIDIHLVSHGSFDPLDQTVTLHIALGEHVRNGIARRVAPFDLRTTRSAVASSLRGACGEPSRYPGVVCSLEGQEVLVGSAAPIVITTELA